MPANLENSVATGLEMVGFHSNPKEKWSRSVASDSLRPHGLQPIRLLHPWDFPGKSAGVDCHFLLQIPKKDNTKECSNYSTIALISDASKVMLKILQARLQQYVNCEVPDVQPGFRKGRGTRDQIGLICWIMEKAREFQKKHLLLLYWLCQSLWLCGSQ